MNTIKQYPVAVFGGLQTLLLAVLAVLSAFNVWTPTDVQRAALLGLWAAITALVSTFIHKNVSPVAGSDA